MGKRRTKKRATLIEDNAKLLQRIVRMKAAVDAGKTIIQCGMRQVARLSGHGWRPLDLHLHRNQTHPGKTFTRNAKSAIGCGRMR